MDKVATFFDQRADHWEAEEEHTRSLVQPAVAIMAGVQEGSRVLDLGCGLGVMMPIYDSLGVASVLGVDISPVMIARAKERWEDYPAFKFAVADGATFDTDETFDAVVIYNAYPHFMDRSALIKNCYRLLCGGGRFIVAHSAGRDEINSHHEAVASGVSLGLKPAVEESKPWEDLFVTDVLVDTPTFFAFGGQRR